MATLLYGSVRSADETLPMPIHAPGARVPAGEDQVAAATTELAPAQPPMETRRNETPPPPPSPAPRWGSSVPSIPPRPGARGGQPRSALPAMVAGLVWTAVVWLGLAVCMIALAYPFSTSDRFWMLMVGTWLIAAGAAYAITSRPETAA